MAYKSPNTQEETPPPPYTHTPSHYHQQQRQQPYQHQPYQHQPAAAAGATGAVTGARPVPPPPLPPRTNSTDQQQSQQQQTPTRAPGAPQFRGTVGAPQLYGEGVTDMSGQEYDDPLNYSAKPIGPRAPQFVPEDVAPSQEATGQQQDYPPPPLTPLSSSNVQAPGILQPDKTQAYYQMPTIFQQQDKKGDRPLQDIKQPIPPETTATEDSYHYQYQQEHASPVVYRPPTAPQFSPVMDHHQQLHSISSVVAGVTTAAVNPTAYPTMSGGTGSGQPIVYSPPPSTPFMPPSTASSPAMSHHYPPPSSGPMFSPITKVNPFPFAPMASMPYGTVSMAMPEANKDFVMSPIPGHVPAPTTIPPATPMPVPTPSLAAAQIPLGQPLHPSMPQGPPGGGPGLTTHFKCKECGGLLDSEFAVCTRLHTPLTAFPGAQIGYQLQGQQPPPPPVPQHHYPPQHPPQHQQPTHYPQPQQAYYHQPQPHQPQPHQSQHHHHNPYQQQQPHYGGYQYPTSVPTPAAHPSNNHGTDDVYYKRPLTNGLKKLLGVASMSYSANHQIVAPPPVAPAHPGVYAQPQHLHQQYYQPHQHQQQHQYAHPGMISPQPQHQHYGFGGGKDGYGGGGLMRSTTQGPADQAPK